MSVFSGINMSFAYDFERFGLSSTLAMILSEIHDTHAGKASLADRPRKRYEFRRNQEQIYQILLIRIRMCKMKGETGTKLIGILFFWFLLEGNGKP